MSLGRSLVSRPVRGLETDSRDELRSRRISTEDMVRFQLAEINALRSNVQNPDRVMAWSEALQALADLLLPWSEQDPQYRAEWEDRPCRVVRWRHPSGDSSKDRLIAAPNAADCREAQRIIMGLLTRSQLLVKRRVISGPGVRASLEALERDGGQSAGDEPGTLAGVR